MKIIICLLLFFINSNLLFSTSRLSLAFSQFLVDDWKLGRAVVFELNHGAGKKFCKKFKIFLFTSCIFNFFVYFCILILCKSK
ncbi:MAG: hypothetical protein CH6_0489 [Candidatus Kapaibacterium sp.]|nr:MAG: hypothetical protein CH6_0489 [Candidatus Kapabacteria bacterium]